MYCTKCGAYLPDEANFCIKCGSRTLSTSESNYTKSEFYTAHELTPAQKEERRKLATGTLVWGIISLALAIASIYVSFLGIIFSGASLRRAKLYDQKYIESSAMVNVGKNLAKAGRIVGIVLTSVLVILLCFAFAPA